ncbi:MAG: VWA domain-containing protein [Candidatus Cloacimonetes bacterium]|nr:VWA domain-containing protein [Candidatus Cloacimonadota bacterium]
MEMELFSGLRIGVPSNYPWIIVSGVVLLLLIFQGKKQKSTIRKMIHDKNEGFLLSDLSSNSKKLATCSFFLIILLSSISLLQPKWGFHWEEVKRHGVDVIVAIDVSKSMLAEDIKPNRLIRAKRKILDLLDIVEGDRVGLIAFAGTSFLQCPLTLDYGAFQMFLDLLDTDLIPQQGTAIDDAIHLSIEAFKSSAKKSKALILITDGEGHSGAYLEAAKKAKEEGIKIYTMGFGSAEGHPIPDPAHKGKNLKDSNGNLVISKLNEQILQEIALETGGVYAQAQNNDDDLQLIYVNEIQTKIQKNNLKSSRQKRFENRFQIFLLLAIVFIFLESYLKQAKSHLPLIKRVLTPKTLALVFFSLSQVSYANSDLVNYFGMASAEEKLYLQGKSSFQDKKFKEASEAFAKAELENPLSTKNLYNVGSSLYKSGDYQRAISYFERSKESEDDSLRASSNYNLGNSHYRMGQLDKAIKAYEEVLKTTPDHEKAKKNLEFVRKKIKEKMDKQKKNQKQQKQQNKDQKQNKDQNQKGEKQESKESQSQKDSQGSKDQQNKQNKNKDQQKKEKDKSEEQKKGSKEKSASEKKKEEEKKAEEAKKKKDQDGKKGSDKKGQMKRGKKLSKEEAQRFLNRMRRENKDQMKQFIKYKLNKQGNGNSGGKEW